MRNIEQRLSRLESTAREVSPGPRPIVMVDEIREPGGNIAQRLEDARRAAGPNGMVVHVRCIGGNHAL